MDQEEKKDKEKKKRSDAIWRGLSIFLASFVLIILIFVAITFSSKSEDLIGLLSSLAFIPVFVLILLLALSSAIVYYYSDKRLRVTISEIVLEKSIEALLVGLAIGISVAVVSGIIESDLSKNVESVEKDVMEVIGEKDVESIKIKLKDGKEITIEK